MSIFYLDLLITSVAMLAVLFLTFFDARLKRVMSLQLYSRAYNGLALVVVIGILVASSLGLGARQHPRQASVAVLEKRV